MSPARSGACPVCQARFRSAATCSRCGADLTALMKLTAEAYRLRQQTREALLRGDSTAASSLAGQAQDLENTPQGRSLRLLAHWLIAQQGGPPAHGPFRPVLFPHPPPPSQ